MKKQLLVSPLFFIFIFASFNLRASHAVGSDLTYSCTGTAGVYKVTFVLYRDCSGIPVCTSARSCSRTLQIMGADGTCAGVSFGTFNVTLVSLQDVNSISICSSVKNTCTNLGAVTPGTFTPAVEKYTFEGTVNLFGFGIPASCCNVSISFTECCRNNNNTGSGGANYYTEAIINRCSAANTPCNSSPVFSNDPVVVTCAAVPLQYSNGAIDPDNDSLSYEFVPALQSSGTAVSYTAPYSPTLPMPWTGGATAPFPGGIRCDPSTGDVMFTPSTGPTAFTGIVVVEVTQWRKISGVATAVGKTRRDMQMIVTSCSPNMPSRILTYPNNTSSPAQVYWEVIAGQQLCFTVAAEDVPSGSSPGDTTFLSWNGGLSSFGATFLPLYAPPRSNGPRQDSFRFCWTPTTAMVSQTPYYFNVVSRDQACPMNGFSSKTFAVLVKPANTAISDNTVIEKLRLFPNPAARRLFVELTSGAGSFTFDVLDLTGRTVLNESAQHSGGMLSRSIDISALPTGLYLVRVQSGNRQATAKVMVESH